MNVRAMTLAHRSDTVRATHQEASFASLLRLEYLKLSKRLMTKIAFGIMALAIGGVQFGGYLIKIVFEIGGTIELVEFLPPNIVEDVFVLISLLGPILTIVLAAGIVGSEYSWGTIRTTVGSGVDRTRLVTAKVVVLVAAGILLVLTGIAVLMLSSTAIFLLEGQGLGFGWITMSRLGELGLMVARSSFVITVYAIVFGFMPAQFARSVAVGLGIGIGSLVVSPVLYLLTGALGNAGERIDDFLPLSVSESLDRLNTYGSPTEQTTGVPDPWQAAATLGLYTAIAIAISIVVFRRRDIAVD